MPLKRLNEIDLTTAAIVGGMAAIAAKLARDSYKKRKENKALKKMGINIDNSDKELIPADVTTDALLMGRELAQQYGERGR
jgi:hypothetical protein